MMNLMFLNFVLVVLAIGYGVGYWLLVTADRQDRKWMNILGTIFGWILISLSILISLLGFYFNVNNKEQMMGGCPMHQMMKQHEVFHKSEPPSMMDEKPKMDDKETPESEEPVKLNDKD